MTDLFRNASISADDIATIERAGYALYHEQRNEEALQLHAIALRLRMATGFTVDPVAELDEEFGIRAPSNVYPLSEYMHLSGRTSA